MILKAKYLPHYLTILCFLVTSLIPPGMMPAQAHNGTITIVICTAQGIVERDIPLDTNGDEDIPIDGEHVKKDCPFSVLTAPVLAQSKVLISQPLRFLLSRTKIREVSATKLGWVIETRSRSPPLPFALDI